MTSYRNRLQAAALILAGGGFLVAPGASSAAGRLAVVSFYEENDVFAGTDQYYTQALKLASLKEQADKPAWLERLARDFWQRVVSTEIPSTFNGGWTLGQNMYTPEDITRATQDPRDRPWAGWLYAGRLLQLTSTCDIADPLCPEQQHTLELDLGVIGPLSGAEWAQTELHRIIDSPEPAGWDNQLDNEPGLLFLYKMKRRLGNRSHTVDAIPHWGFAAGNVLTYLAAGGTLRVGRNLSGFGTDLIPAVIREHRPGWEAYLFAGAEARAVAQNIFLDGNTFGDSHRVAKEPIVYDLLAGASLRLRQLRLTYTLVERSREFETQARSLSQQHFGAVMISWERSFGQ